MSILKDRIRPLDPSSNQVFLEPDREAEVGTSEPSAHETRPTGQLHAVTRDAEGHGTGK